MTLLVDLINDLNVKGVGVALETKPELANTMEDGVYPLYRVMRFANVMLNIPGSGDCSELAKAYQIAELLFEAGAIPQERPSLGRGVPPEDAPKICDLARSKHREFLAAQARARDSGVSAPPPTLSHPWRDESAAGTGGAIASGGLCLRAGMK